MNSEQAHKTIWAISERQIKTAMRYQHTTVMMTKLKMVTALSMSMQRN
jgi:hypothetical protein